MFFSPAFQEVSHAAIRCHIITDSIRVDLPKQGRIFRRYDEITWMDDLPYALNCFRLLQPIQKSAMKLRLLCQVFRFSKGVSGLLIVVVRIMKFKQTRCLGTGSLAKVQKRHWLSI